MDAQSSLNRGPFDENPFEHQVQILSSHRTICLNLFAFHWAFYSDDKVRRKQSCLQKLLAINWLKMIDHWPVF